MKKYVVFICLLLVISVRFVYASEYKTGFVNCYATDNESLYVRKSPGSLEYNALLTCNKALTILNQSAGSTSDCANWYKVSYGIDKEGYVCSKYVYMDYEMNEGDYQISYTNKAYVDCRSENITLNLRNGINGSVIASLSCNQEMTIIEENAGSNSLCSKWYKVSSGGKTGYACSEYTYREAVTTVSSTEISKYEKYLSDMGFPSSYISALVELHKVHPKWRFRLLNTKLNWQTVIDNENVLGRNLLYYTYGEGYRSLDPVSYNWETDTFNRHPTETNWWYASEDAIKYYMDPRNFLSEKDVFMFEVLSYQPTYQNNTLIRSLLDKSFMPTIYKNFYGEANMYNYAGDFILAGDTYDVSPSHLASRIIQEGNNKSQVEYNGKKYTVFNFFNIRATGTNPQYRGLLWAAALGEFAGGTSYGRVWDTPKKSIMGGAEFLSKDYISIGQDTLYFQKFAVSVKNGRYSHQYMQNITAPLTEGGKVYNAYKSVNSLDEDITFIIPMYLNMPTQKVNVPKSGNPNYYLSNITVNGTSIENFKYDKLSYKLDTEEKKVTIKATPINAKATYKVTGNTTLVNGNNSFTIKVTAENGNSINYKLTINKLSNETNVVVENTIENITVDAFTLGYNKDILTYDKDVDYEVSKLKVTYTLSDKTVHKLDVDLKVGMNTINIKENTHEYVINVNRLNPQIDYVLSNIGIKYDDNYISGINVNSSIDSFINNVLKIDKLTTVTIKDSKGNKKSTTFATGDKINIKNSLEERNYEVLIYGDINGDGKIDKLDASAILRAFYKYANYDGVYKEAADINKDGKIDKLDVLAVLRDYYGYAKISQ